jgi:hypothetical protein
MGKESRVRGCGHCWLGVQNHGLVACNTNKGSPQLLSYRVFLWRDSLIALQLHSGCGIMMIAIVSSDLINIFTTYSFSRDVNVAEMY